MDVKQVEADLQIAFPDDYRSLSIPSAGACMRALADVWHLPGAADLLYYIREGLESDCFPDNGIVIAYNGCGDYLLLRRSAQDNSVDSTVFRFDYETGETLAVSEDLAILFSDIRPYDEFSRLLREL